MKLVILIAGYLLVFGCTSNSTKEKQNISADRQRVKEKLSNEVSLKDDRTKLDALRKDIPEEKKKENDELAFFLKNTGELKDEPNRVRERWQTLVQKKRSHFNEAVDRLRRDYDKEERKRRDEFNSAQSRKREDYNRGKKPGDKTREFYADIEKERLNFYSADRDRRKDFDEEVHQQTKDFNEYMKERTDEFNEQMRLYTQRFNEAKKQKAAEKTSTPVNSPDLGQ